MTPMIWMPWIIWARFAQSASAGSLGPARKETQRQSQRRFTEWRQNRIAETTAGS